MALKEHSAFVIILLGMVLVSKVNWGSAVPRGALAADQPVCPTPQPVIIVLSSPLKKEDGSLRKATLPLTKPGNLLGVLEAELFEVSAYAVGDDHTPGLITADGREVRPGVTAACPPEIPLGTALYVEGFGVRICEDRGSAVVGKRIDIAFPSVESALIFGRQRLAVAIIR